jgi:hypothetical protein
MKNIAPIQRRGLRWGQLLVGLEEAGRSLKDASRGKDLLSAKDKKTLERLFVEVKELEVRAWVAENKSVEPPKRKKAK